MPSWFLGSRPAGPYHACASGKPHLRVALQQALTGKSHLLAHSQADEELPPHECDRAVISSIEIGGSSLGGASRCEGCQPGTYVSGLGCEPCPAGTASNTIGANECQQCPAGTYSNLGFTTCRPCPVGTESEAGASECSFDCNNLQAQDFDPSAGEHYWNISYLAGTMVPHLLYPASSSPKRRCLPG